MLNFSIANCRRVLDKPNPGARITSNLHLMALNPLKSELFTKQACRDAVVIYSFFFSPTTYTSLYSCVLSTVLRISNFTLYIYIYIYICCWRKKKQRIRLVGMQL